MDKSFHEGNRSTLYDSLEDGTIVLTFAGSAPRLSADAYHPFFADRNFVYLTGLENQSQGFILMAQKSGGTVSETAFILPPDERAERWAGARLRREEVERLSGITLSQPLGDFDTAFHRAANSGRFRYVALDLNKLVSEEPDDCAHRFAKQLAQQYPWMQVINYHRQLRRQRTFKKPCEIEAMKEAMKITKAGILAMMKIAKPGVYEYEFKAAFDKVLTERQIFKSSFPPIISAGENNFCIHYYGYTGQAKDGDMVLNDVGACWDGMYNDVSRSWPVNGKFNERQRIMYECAYKTSEYMFSIIKPGMPMADVDLTIRKYCYELLKEAELVDSYENVGKLMWHGGAHHVGYDVHDVVDASIPVSAGMVFCVDIGIYNLDWGIGFRLEDNCYVTESGCVNLSADIPRSIEEIEAAMAK